MVGLVRDAIQVAESEDDGASAALVAVEDEPTVATVADGRNPVLPRAKRTSPPLDAVTIAIVAVSKVTPRAGADTHDVLAGPMVRLLTVATRG